jgi:hypothetical protein
MGFFLGKIMKIGSFIPLAVALKRAEILDL